MISKFEQWRLRKGKHVPSNRQRLIALKALINAALKNTISDTSIGTINHAAESNPDIQPSDEEVIEMANLFDKGWQKTYEEWMSMFDGGSEEGDDAKK